MLTDRLALLRREKNLNKKDIATYLKIDQSTYGKYELGKREPDYDTLIVLANFFDVSVDYLLGRTDIRKAHSYDIEAKHYHSLVRELPEEAVKQVEEYIELIKLKYKSDGNLNKKV